MTEKLSAGLLSLHKTAVLCVPFAALFLTQSAAAAGAVSAPAGQTVVSVLPSSEAQQKLVPDQTWVPTNPKTFTGEAVMKSVYRQASPARNYGAYVHFSPGAAPSGTCTRSVRRF